MIRDEAIDRLRTPEMSETFLKQEFGYVADKLMLGEKALTDLLLSPKRTFSDYKNKQGLIMAGAKLMTMLGVENRYFR